MLICVSFFKASFFKISLKYLMLIAYNDGVTPAHTPHSHAPLAYLYSLHFKVVYNQQRSQTLSSVSPPVAPAVRFIIHLICFKEKQCHLLTKGLVVMRAFGMCEPHTHTPCSSLIRLAGSPRAQYVTHYVPHSTSGHTE